MQSERLAASSPGRDEAAVQRAQPIVVTDVRKVRTSRSARAVPELGVQGLR